MSVVSFALALPLVLLFVAMLTYLLARRLSRCYPWCRVGTRGRRSATSRPDTDLPSPAFACSP
jgi:hypothetical protein